MSTWRRIGFIFNMLFGLQVTVGVGYDMGPGSLAAAMFYVGMAIRTISEAREKGRTTFSWEFFCVFAPLLALLFLAFKKKRLEDGERLVAVFE
jgi:hypothetical protein